MSVRTARPEDAEPVARLQLATWRAAYDFLPAEALDVPVEQAAALWRRAIEAPPTPRHRVLVALDGAHLVGFAATEPTEPPALPSDAGEPGRPAEAELTALLVEPRWGRRGHGSRLLAATVQHWRDDDVARATHWAWAQDAAVRSLLVSAGWDRDGAARELDLGGRTARQVRFHTAPGQ